MKKKKKGRKMDLPKSRRSAKRRYQKDQLIRRVKDSQKHAEGGGLSILKPDVDVNIWRPSDGSHIIDIIPYITGKQNVEGDKPGKVHYTFHYYIHKNVGPNNDWYVCPARTWGDDCPICEHRAKLLDQGADYDSKVAPLNTKERNLYNVLVWDKGEEKKGVQIWDVSYYYFEKHVIALSKKPARGGRSEKTVVFFDEEEGKSISFTIEPAKSKDDYPSFVGHSFDDRDYELDDEILDSAHCLDELVHKPSYEELEKAFWGTKSPGSRDSDDDDDDDDDGESSYEMLIDDLDEIEDQDELDDFVDEHDIDVKMKKNKFKKNKRSVRIWLEEASEEQNSVDDEDDDDDEDDEDEITTEDIEEMDKDELSEYCDDNELEPPKKVRKNVKKFRKWVIEQLDDEDDEDDDDDEDEDDDSKYTADDIEEMNKRQLKKLIKEEGLKIKIKKKDDAEDIQDKVMDALGID